MFSALVSSEAKIGKSVISSGLFNSQTIFLFTLPAALAVSIKVSLDNLIFSEGDSEIYLDFCALLRSPDRLTMPTNGEGNSGNDICGKALKIRFKPLSSFFQKKIANVDHETLRLREKHAGASRPSCLPIRFKFKVKKYHGVKLFE